MNFFDLITNIYQKNKLTDKVNDGILISINKWLSFDKDNLLPIQKILKYLFYIEPLHFYYLLFFNIPKKFKVPFLRKAKKTEEKEDELVRKIQDFLGWSDRELRLNRKLLELTILKNRRYWGKEFGLEKA